MKPLRIIETEKDLAEFIQVNQPNPNHECILRVYDNKSDVLLQSIVVKHPVLFIRGISEFCKSANIPVSDLSVYFIGFISEYSYLTEISDIIEISPYVYFKKSEEVETTSEQN